MNNELGKNAEAKGIYESPPSFISFLFGRLKVMWFSYLFAMGFFIWINGEKLGVLGTTGAAGFTLLVSIAIARWWYWRIYF